MARGRPKSATSARYPSGDLRRPGTAEREAIEERRAAEMKSVALMQPHRGGRAGGAAKDPRRNIDRIVAQDGKVLGRDDPYDTIEDIRRGVIGNEDMLAESAVGRFVRGAGLRSEIYDGASAYWDLRQRWLASWGAPRDAGKAGNAPSGTGEGPKTETAQRWLDRICSAEAAAARAGGQWALNDLRSLMAGQDYHPSHIHLQLALVAVATAMGHYVDKDHPFA